MSLLALCAAATAIAAPLVADEQWVNGDFEQGTPGSTPPGWTLSPNGEATTRIEGVFQGQQDGVLLRGSLSQSLGIDGLAGHHLEVRLHLRPESDTTGRVQVVARSKGARVWSRGREVRDPAGETVRLGVELPDSDALTLELVVAQAGAGALHVDAVALADLGPLPPYQSHPLAPDAAARILAFSKLYARVRWFHPADATLTADWDAIALEGVSLAEQTADPHALANQWQSLLQPVAPTVQVWSGDPPAPTPSARGDWNVGWYHLGPGLTADGRQDPSDPNALLHSGYRRYRVDDAGRWWTGLRRQQVIHTLDVSEWQEETVRLEVDAQLEGSLEARLGLTVPGSGRETRSPPLRSGTSQLLTRLPPGASELQIFVELSGPGAVDLTRMVLAPMRVSPLRRTASSIGMYAVYALLLGSIAMAGSVWTRRTIGGFVIAVVALTGMAILAQQGPEVAWWIPFAHMQNLDGWVQENPDMVARASDLLGGPTRIGTSLGVIAAWLGTLFALTAARLHRMDIRGGGD